MKTPIQELIDRINNEEFDHLDDCKMFIQESLLEKEEERIKKCIVMGMEFIPVDPSRYEEDSELIFNETFKPKRDEDT